MVSLPILAVLLFDFVFFLSGLFRTNKTGAQRERIFLAALSLFHPAHLTRDWENV